jgi:hypothetical protein
MRWNKRWQNFCSSCGYSWSPRGHYVSAACPRCGGGNVKVPALGCTSTGCLVVVGGIIVMVLAVKIDAALAGVSKSQLVGALLVAGAIAAGVALVWWRLRVRARAVADESQRREEADRVRARAVAEEQRRQADESQRREEADRRRQRREQLVARFGVEAADMILAGKLWVGATSEMVVAALGPPDATSERVFKTKTRRIHKYRPLGRGKFGLKVTLEDSVVIGWDEGD